MVVATDGEGQPGSPATVLLDFDRACSIWRDQNGNLDRILLVPEELPFYERLGLCTSIGIERLEIVESEAITDLMFMENITVCWYKSCHSYLWYLV